MPIYYNNQKIKNITFQNQSIGKGYYGSTLVYQKIIPKLNVVRPFTTAGTFNWRVPANVYLVDVFLVGGGGGGSGPGMMNGSATNFGGGGGGGYTATYYDIPVTPNTNIQVIIGAGGVGKINLYTTGWRVATNGGFSQFMNSSYRANGGYAGGGNNGDWNGDYSDIEYSGFGGDGGSGGAGKFELTVWNYYTPGIAGSNGSNGTGVAVIGGTGQGTNTRDFGEQNGLINAGGGGDGGVNINVGINGYGGISDYVPGSGSNGYSTSGIGYGTGGGGYGGGGGGYGTSISGNRGGDGGIGTCLIRY